MGVEIYAESTTKGNRYCINFGKKATIRFLTANDMHKLRKELKEWGYK